MTGYPRVLSPLASLLVLPLPTRYFPVLFHHFNKVDIPLLLVAIFHNCCGNISRFLMLSLSSYNQVVDDVLKRLFQFKREEVLQSV
jgi:hypothetical protein